MIKTELESKYLAELHSLAADAGVPRYRMLRRAELIEKLLEEKPQPRPRRERPKPESRRRPERAAAPAERVAPSTQPAAAAPTAVREAPAVAAPRPKRRRRRPWGRRGRKGVRIQDLLLPAAPGRQAIVYAESRERCTALLRELAAELSGAGKGPDPIALLIDPSPEELADWRREAPRAEIIAAGQARHAEDAVAQAARRAEGGEAVILLIDSLSRFAEAYGDADGAKGLYDAGREPARSAGGSLTVVAAVERP
jgi:Rho termination factor, N-terminal domain